MYSQYRCLPAASCMVMNEGTEPRDCASSFVNPLTALAMVETMKMEGHTALVHTAAASNLGQMLVKICVDDGVQLVNIVRKQEHVDLLKSIGAEFVCNSSDDDFMEQLTQPSLKQKPLLPLMRLAVENWLEKFLLVWKLQQEKMRQNIAPMDLQIINKSIYMGRSISQGLRCQIIEALECIGGLADFY